MIFEKSLRPCAFEVSSLSIGRVKMDEWSNALPLTASCLSPLRACPIAEWSKTLPLTVSCLSPYAAGG